MKNKFSRMHESLASCQHLIQMFDKAKQLCISFAEQNGFVLHKQKITIINTENTAVYGKETGKSMFPRYVCLDSNRDNALDKWLS